MDFGSLFFSSSLSVVGEDRDERPARFYRNVYLGSLQWGQESLKKKNAKRFSF